VLEFWEFCSQPRQRAVGRPDVGEYGRMGNCTSDQHIIDDFERIDKTAAHHDDVGNEFYNKYEDDKASKHFKKSLKIRRKSFGKKNRDVARSYDRIATICYDKGQFKEAIKYYHKSLKIKLEIHGCNNLELSETYNNLGSAYCRIKNFDEALDFHKKVLEIELERAKAGEAIFVSLGSGSNSKDEGIDDTTYCNADRQEALAFAYGNMAVDFFGQQDYINAVTYQQRCIDILTVELGPNDHYTEQAIENIKEMRDALKKVNIELNDNDDQESIKLV